MNGPEKHPIKKWEVSLIEIEKDGKVIFKLTRRMSEMEVAETKIFQTKEAAKKQLEEWLR